MPLFRRSKQTPRRRKSEQFEGWFEATPNSPCPGVGGKIEWDGFDNGDSEIELFARIPEIADGVEVEVRWGDQTVMTVVARRGIVKKDLETEDGDEVPRLANQTVELRFDGHVIGRAVLRPD